MTRPGSPEDETPAHEYASELDFLIDRWRLAQSGRRGFVLLSSENRDTSMRILNELRNRVDADALKRIPSAEGGQGAFGALQEVFASADDAEDLVRRVAEACAHHPILLVVENLRGADLPMLDVLGRLLDVGADLALLAVIVCRPGFVPPWDADSELTRLRPADTVRPNEDDETEDSGPAAPQSPGRVSPERVGPYLVEDRLGVGGMGVVYRAWDKRLRRRVALKQIRGEADLRARRRFRREARLAAALDHPGIVRVYDVLEDDGCDWIVMELVEGSSLAERLGRPPDLSLAVRYAKEIAAALAAAHEEGIVHRDLKAGNLVVDDANRIRILDFGLAKQVDGEPGDETATISVEGQVLGTPTAMSPEQAMGRPVDARSDLFSLGSLIYEMVSGVSPFRGDTRVETLQRVCAAQPPPLSETAPATPRALSDLVDRLLAKDPQARPRGAAQAALLLQRIERTLDAAIATPRRIEPPSAAPESTAASPSVAAISERRRLTVLCGEIVGEDGSLDPETLFSVMDRFEQIVREVVEQAGGRATHFLDCRATACFGFPHAREDDAVRAAHAAAKLLQRCREELRLKARVGVHSGPAVVSSAGRLALGATLDRAVELRDRAAPDEAFLSEATQRLAEARSSRGSGETSPMIAREKELALIRDRLREARSGRGRAVWIVGEAGIGKSRLLDALARETQMRWSTIQASSHGRSAPFEPIVQWLRELLEIDARASSSEQIAVLRQAAPGSESVAFLADLLGLPAECDAVREALLKARPELRKKKTLQALTDVLLASAHRESLVLAVEDLHWLDPSSLEWLAHWLAQDVEAPVLLLLTSRPEFTPTWNESPRLTQLKLDRLSRREAEQMLDALVGERAFAAKTREQILAKTDGVPLFLAETVRAISEDPEHREIPATLRDLLTARLDRLGPAKTTAQAASVIGREFSQDLLAAISPQAEPLAEALDRLVSAGLIYRKGFSKRRRYVFQHALVQDAAYDSLLESDRCEYHERAALALERHFDQVCEERPDLLAFHWRRANVFDRAVPYFGRAGDLSKAVSAQEEAAAFYAQGLESLRKIASWNDSAHWRAAAAGLQESAGDVQIACRRLDLATEAFTAAIGLRPRETSETQDTEARLHRKLGNALHLSGRYEEAATSLRRARKALSGKRSLQDISKKSALEQIEIQFVEYSIAYREGRLDDMGRLLKEFSPLVEEYGGPLHQAQHSSNQVLFGMRSSRFRPPRSVLAQARDAYAACERVGDRHQTLVARATLGMVALLCDEIEFARQEFSAGLPEAQKFGEATIEAIFSAYLSLTWRRQGRVVETGRWSRILIEQPAFSSYHGFAEGNFAWIAWKEGRTEDAVAHGEKAYAAWEETHSPFHWVAAFPLLAAGLERGDRRRNEELIEDLFSPAQMRLPDEFGTLENARADRLILTAEKTGYL